MKLFLDKQKLDEITLNLLEINLLIDYKNTSDCFKTIYEFMINSDLIDAKTKSILKLHGKSDYFKAYEILLKQSDISNTFYEKLSNYLLYIEFMNYMNSCKYFEENNTNGSKNFTKKHFNFGEGLNSYFGQDIGFDEKKELFFKRRQKIINFFGINLDKIKSFKLESVDQNYIIEEINYSYKSILKLLKEFRIVYISHEKRELESMILPTNNSIRNEENFCDQEIKLGFKLSEMIKFNIRHLLNNFKIISPIEENQSVKISKSFSEEIEANSILQQTNNFLMKHEVKLKFFNKLVKSDNLNEDKNYHDSEIELGNNFVYEKLSNVNVNKISSSKKSQSYKINFENGIKIFNQNIYNEKKEKKLSLMDINQNIRNLGKTDLFKNESELKPNNFNSFNEIISSIESPIIHKNKSSINFDRNSNESYNSDFFKKNFVNNNENHDLIKSENNEDTYKRTKTDQEFLLKLKIFQVFKNHLKYKKINKDKKQILYKKEQTAKIFYNKLLKSRTFYGLIKNIRNKKYFQIISNNYYYYQELNIRRNLLKILIFSYNRKKMAENFLAYKLRKKKDLLFRTFRTKIKFRIQNRKLYFNQLAEKDMCIEFMLFLMEISKNFKFVLRKNMSFTYNYNIMKIKKDAYFKNILFKTLKMNWISTIEKEKNLINLSYSLQNKFKKDSINENYSKFIRLLRILRRKKYVKNFKKKIFLMRFYFKKYKKDSIHSKKINLKNKFVKFMISHCISKLLNNSKNIKKKNILIIKLAENKILKNNINLYHTDNNTDQEMVQNSKLNNTNSNINSCKVGNVSSKNSNQEISKNFYTGNKESSIDKNKNNSFNQSLISLSNSLINTIENNKKNQIHFPKQEFDIVNRNQDFQTKDINDFIRGDINENFLTKLKEIKVRIVFNFLKKYTKFKMMKICYKKHILLEMKKNFFKNLRILCIKGLIIQAIKEKYSILKRKIFLLGLMKCSYNKKRIEQFHKIKTSRLISIIFSSWKNLKYKNSRLILAKVKFILKSLFLKIKSKKILKIKRKLQNEAKKKLMNFKIFFKRSKKIIHRKLIKSEYNENFSPIVKGTIYKTSFFFKLKRKIKLKSVNQILIKKNYIKQMKISIENLKKKEMIKLLRKKLVKIKYFKWFLKNTFKYLDVKYYNYKLEKLSKKYLISTTLKKLEDSFKSRELILQILQYSKIKKLAKIFGSLKKNYLNSIKFKIIKQNYQKYMIVNFLKVSIKSLLIVVNKRILEK